jgi:hypothetical protein
MDNFDLKQFLVENKLTENSRLGEIKTVPGNTGIKDKGKLKIGDTITPEMWDKQKIETYADAEELIPYDEIIQDSYFIKDMQFDEGDAEAEADWMVQLRDKNNNSWGITGTPEELSFLNNLLKDKYIIVSPDNLKEIKAVPGNTGIDKLKSMIDKWLVDHTKLIKDLKKYYRNEEYPKSSIIDDLYDTSDFEEFAQSVNGGTEEEDSFANGWTDDKDELFSNRLGLFLDKTIKKTSSRLEEIKAIPGNTGIKNTLTFTFEEVKGKMVFIEIDEDGDDSKEYMQINTLDDYNRLKNVIADYSKSGILVDYYPY